MLTASKKFKKVLKIYGGLSASWSDVAVQTKKEIGILSRLKDELNFTHRNLYYYRPQERTFKKILSIIKELENAHLRNRRDGRNDLKKDLSIEKSQKALDLINSAFDDVEDILLLPGILHEISERKGLHMNYIGDRLWHVIASAVIALLTATIGLLAGLLIA